MCMCMVGGACGGRLLQQESSLFDGIKYVHVQGVQLVGETFAGTESCFKKVSQRF